MAGLDALRHLQMSAGLRDVGDEVAGPVQLRKLMQQVADINFIPRQVTADGVSVN